MIQEIYTLTLSDQERRRGNYEFCLIDVIDLSLYWVCYVILSVLKKKQLQILLKHPIKSGVHTGFTYG